GHDSIVIVTLQDLTRLHRAEESVRLLSYSDAATGLPNRRYLTEQITNALKEGVDAQAFGVVAFRFHGFDRVVQAQGMPFSNVLVGEVAKRIEAELVHLSRGGGIIWRTDRPAVSRTADGELARLMRRRV